MSLYSPNSFEGDINSLYIDELNEYVKDKGWPKFRAKQVFEWLHKKHVTSVDEMTNIPKAIRDELDQDITHVKYVTHQTDSEDGTRKFLFEMEDGFEKAVTNGRNAGLSDEEIIDALRKFMEG